MPQWFHTRAPVALAGSSGGLRMFVNLVKPLIRSRFSRQTLRRYLSNPARADLQRLAAMVERGEIRPVVGASIRSPRPRKVVVRVAGA